MLRNCLTKKEECPGSSTFERHGLPKHMKISDKLLGIPYRCSYTQVSYLHGRCIWRTTWDGIEIQKHDANLKFSMDTDSARCCHCLKELPVQGPNYHVFKYIYFKFPGCKLIQHIRKKSSTIPILFHQHFCLVFFCRTRDQAVLR